MKIALQICTLLTGAIVPLSAAAQSCVADFAGGRKVESERYVLFYRTKPEPVAVSQHFAVEIAVCPKGGQPAPEIVRVDGFMPEHNHGMNYKATVKAGGGGRYDAAGLMFHMPGRWDFIFEVRAAGKTDRMTATLMLQ